MQGNRGGRRGFAEDAEGRSRRDISASPRAISAGSLERPQGARVPTFEFSGAPRSLSVWPYVIFYEPLAGGDGIALWRILHGARRMDDLLKPPDRFA